MELSEFCPEEVQNLAWRHKLNWQDTQAQQLMTIVGGHPYLVRLALYSLARRDVTLEELLQYAPTDAGIYGAHLRRHLDILQQNPKLATALKQVVTATEAVRLETMLAYTAFSRYVKYRDLICHSRECGNPGKLCTSSTWNPL